MRAVFPSVLVIVPSTTSNNLIFGFNQSIDAEELMSRIAKVDDPVIQQVLSAPLQFYRIESADGAFTDDLAPVEQVVHQMILSVTSD